MVLAVFAKAPVAGQVKTRLSPPLLPQQAAQLYATLLDETLQRFAGKAFELVICFAGDESYFADRYPQLTRQPQQGADLGERLANTLQGFLATGYRQAVIIGSDSPDLPLVQVEQAFRLLQQVEVVIAPAHDGGYVLIGESSHHPQLFAGMPWSQSNLMDQTKRILAAQRIGWQQLPGWEDVDDEASLLRLLHRTPQSLTANFIRQQLGFLLEEKSPSKH